MVEQSVSHQNWPTYSLQRLEQAIQGAKDANKYLFIWDKQGSVGTFLNYKGHLASLAPEVIKATLQRQTSADVAEFIRKHWISAMRNGENLCLDIEKVSPDFAALSVEGTFVADRFFDWNWMSEQDNYMTFVREDENHGIGGLNPGFGYIRAPKFFMIIRSGVENEEDLNSQISKITNFHAQFHPVVIQ